MRKINLIILMLILLVTACTNNVQGTNFETDNGNISNETNENEEELGADTEESIENSEIEIDKIECFTGEIITDGNYEISTEAYGSIVLYLIWKAKN